MTIFHEALFSCFLNILVQFGLDKLIKTKYTSSPNVNGPEYFRCEFCLCKNNITKTPTKHFLLWVTLCRFFLYTFHINDLKELYDLLKICWPRGLRQIKSTLSEKTAWFHWENLVWDYFWSYRELWGLITWTGVFKYKIMNFIPQVGSGLALTSERFMQIEQTQVSLSAWKKPRKISRNSPSEFST